MELSLRTHQLSIGHGGLSLCRGIDFNLSSGQILCLLGPNGCGKTTLFKTILGLLPPVDGDIILNGTSICELSRTRLARQIAYVPQQHAPPFPYTTAEVVMMARAAHLPLFGQPGKQDYLAVDNALSQLGISSLANQDYSQLSGGQRQLILIARALAQETPFIIMDEPTASLDFGNEAIVMRQIAALTRTMASANRGIILSTHNPDQAFTLNADVLLMHAQSVIGQGRPQQALTADKLSLAYGTPVSVEQTQSGHTVCVPTYSPASPSMPALP
ncbi:ABC transporter ATP-binding protein [Granulosicoccus antarcticus]|uniref:Putative ABC transporter ATP-binding protein n=1 Tax=Granulosicoccus antarcticus IMCC3135 TaxID=1192854 RepID=A0A2Z2NLV0_9GAMM|nr:ABC transporter ATP-binding protein [Granulosicoccus antarcticus]ASJ70951.1 putative ABC transporter ATP-binding protein [Granulosicoccus antarcticus IMCC3135]